MNNRLNEFSGIVDELRNFRLQDDLLNTGSTVDAGELGQIEESKSKEAVNQLVETVDTAVGSTIEFAREFAREFALAEKKGEFRQSSAHDGYVLAGETQLPSLDQAVPHIAVNDGLGASGSREFGESLTAVAAIANAQGRFCAGTLIAPDVVLSARHCEISNADRVVFGSDYSNSEFTVDVASVVLPAGESDVYFDGGDIAIVQLTANVPASIAAPLRLISDADSLVGETATIAGYGNNGVGSVGHNSTSDGFRWGGQNVIDHYGDFSNGENLFLADFDDGSGPANTLGGALNSSAIPLEYEAITSTGDSGSPLLVNIDGELVVAAVTSFGLDILGQYGSITFWTGVAPFEQDVLEAGGSFVSGSITEGNLPPADDHSGNIMVETTDLEFEPLGNGFVARKNGEIGFGDTPIETDVFSFTTSESGRIIVDAKALANGLDTKVELYDAEGNLVGQNDNSEVPDAENPEDSKLVLREVPAGEYFVSVSANDESTGSYRLAVRTSGSVAELDHGGKSFRTASSIVLDPFAPTTFIRASVSEGRDRDFFKFTARASGRLVVRSNALNGNLNTVLRGFDGDRRRLAGNNNFRGSLDSRIQFDVLEGESYFLKLSSVGSSTGEYGISVRYKDGGNGGGTAPFVNLTLDAEEAAGSIAAGGDIVSHDRLDQYGVMDLGIAIP